MLLLWSRLLQLSVPAVRQAHPQKQLLNVPAARAATAALSDQVLGLNSYVLHVLRAALLRPCISALPMTLDLKSLEGQFVPYESGVRGEQAEMLGKVKSHESKRLHHHVTFVQLS